MFGLKQFACATTALTLLMAASAHAANNIWFIIDASGSMRGKIDGQRKMEVAKRTLQRLVSQVDPQTRVNLLAYGHRRDNDCSDISVLATGLTGNRTHQVSAALQQLQPLGKTPIADSLRMVGAIVRQQNSDDTNTVVLVSDGIETCGGDPCQVAGELARDNIKLRTHVVGFAIEARDRAQLECIAREGNGKYFAANSTEGFAEAVRGAIRLAQAEPQPPAITWREVFRDDFDGEALREDWVVHNPDPEAYAVEDGKLLLLVSDPKTSKVAPNQQWSKLPNVLRLAQPLPRGDWTMTVRFSFPLQTFGETVGIGVADEKLERMIVANLRIWSGTFNNGREFTAFHVAADKLGKRTARFEELIYKDRLGKPSERAKWFNAKVQSMELRLRRTGRKYQAAIRVFEKTDKGIKPTDWITTGALGSLRAPGKHLVLFAGSFPYHWAYTKSFALPAFTNGNWYVPKNMENTIEIDWVKIETPAEE